MTSGWMESSRNPIDTCWLASSACNAAAFDVNVPRPPRVMITNAVQRDDQIDGGDSERLDRHVGRALPGVGCHWRQTTTTARAARAARAARTETQTWQASPAIATNPAATTLVDDRDAATAASGLTGRLNARHNHNTANGNATANPVITCRPIPGSHKPSPRAWTTTNPTTT
jgi:hypothetical protein